MLIHERTKKQKDIVIDEIAQILSRKYLPVSVGSTTIGDKNLSYNEAHILATQLYAQGYKHETDVAEEIFNNLYNQLNDHAVYISKEDLITTAKQYNITLGD